MSALRPPSTASGSRSGLERSQALLRAEALAIGYPGHPVGAGLDLTLHAGEVLCLLGPNGGGKTTLMRTLLGLLPALGGRVMLDGRALESLARRDIARHLAFVPQSVAGYFPFTVRELVRMGRTAHLPLFGSPSREDEAIADEAIDRLGIAHLADMAYTRISGGERQLALIARALAQQAPLLVMDEPTASLDFGNQARVLGEIRRLADDGIGVLFSSHDPSHGFRCADRVAMMRGGELLAQGPVEPVLSADALFALYGIRVRLLSGDGPRSTVCVPAPGVRESDATPLDAPKQAQSSVRR
ncbi:MAG: ABC transporter ATP-binding protein [Burkholderiaceae bacterium]